MRHLVVFVAVLAVVSGACAGVNDMAEPGSVIVLAKAHEFDVGNSDGIKCSPLAITGKLFQPMYKFGDSYTMPSGTVVRVANKSDDVVVVEIETVLCEGRFRSALSKKEYVEMAEAYVRLTGKTWAELQAETQRKEKEKNLLRKTEAQQKKS